MIITDLWLERDLTPEVPETAEKPCLKCSAPVNMDSRWVQMCEECFTELWG